MIDFTRTRNEKTSYTVLLSMEQIRTTYHLLLLFFDFCLNIVSCYYLWYFSVISLCLQIAKEKVIDPTDCDSFPPSPIVETSDDRDSKFTHRRDLS